MKVKVINKNTNQQFDCEEIIIDGFKYYINSSNKDFKTNELSVYKKWKLGIVTNVNEDILEFEGEFIDESNLYKIICCNNPNLDIPKVVDEVEKLAYDKFPYTDTRTDFATEECRNIFKIGYNKSQETHPFSEEDIIEFAEWKLKNLFSIRGDLTGNILWGSNNKEYKEIYTTKELLQLWKEQKPKIVYYEK